MSQELLTQICEKMPDELTPFVIHYLTTQYGKDAPSSCSLVWGKRKVQPTYEGLHAYLEELGFQSRMEHLVNRARRCVTDRALAEVWTCDNEARKRGNHVPTKVALQPWRR